MSKRQRVTRDLFYQGWHFKRSLELANTPKEFAISVPYPLKSPPAGRYHAIELHSVTWNHSTLIRHGQAVHIAASLSYVPRLGCAPFVTGPGDPENIWWEDAICDLEAANNCPTIHIRNSATKKVELDDNLKHGKLITGQNIYLQLDTTGMAVPAYCNFTIAYTFTSVPCAEYVQELVAQLTSV